MTSSFAIGIAICTSKCNIALCQTKLCVKHIMQAQVQITNAARTTIHLPTKSEVADVSSYVDSLVEEIGCMLYVEVNVESPVSSELK